MNSDSNHLIDAGALRGNGACFIGTFFDDVCTGCFGVQFFQGKPVFWRDQMALCYPAYRGKAISSKLMAEIEQAIIADGIDMVRLETRVLQKTTIGLYESLGCYHIQPFGSYIDDPLSLFMEKHLVPSASA